MYWGSEWHRFPKAARRPKPKPGKKRKKFGETWWGKKWVDILSDYEHDQRMSRGRAYARADMVKNFKIGKCSISAKVKGSSGSYSVTISFDKFNKKEWGDIHEKLRCSPILLGKLLNNEMPEEIVEATGYSFIPESFDADCSCPDYANPCKHIAAVFYTVADEIDHDPLIVFKLRGMGKDELFKALELVDEGEYPESESKEKSKKTKPKIKAKPKPRAKDKPNIKSKEKNKKAKAKKKKKAKRAKKRRKKKE